MTFCIVIIIFEIAATFYGTSHLDVRQRLECGTATGLTGFVLCTVAWFMLDSIGMPAEQADPILKLGIVNLLAAIGCMTLGLRTTIKN